MKMTMKAENKEGLLVIVSGPAGVGKGTLCRALLKQWPELEYSVSVTTRKARPSENEGKEYYFRSKEQFREMIEEEEFLEWAEFCGNYYGTPLFHVENMLKRGKTIVLEIDVQGAKQVKEKFPKGVFIFIVPPSFEILSKRLYGRGTETEDIIKRRLDKAAQELEMMQDYDYAVVNDQVTDAVEKLKSIVIAEKCSIKRMY